MKIIFLDIDGVLNSNASCIALGGVPWPMKPYSWQYFDRVAVGLLRKAVSQTGAACVLSSSWRHHLDHEELDKLAKRLKVPIIGSTAATRGSESRGEQIQEWLDNNSGVAQYVIVDDDADMLPEQQDNFVRVNPQDGLSFQNYLDMTKILGMQTN